MQVYWKLLCRVKSALVVSAAPVIATLATPVPSIAQTAVATWHYDMARTGWNAKETALTQAVVSGQDSGAAFGLLGMIPLDQQVDAQPLVVPNVKVQGDPNAGTHDVVYVATEANTVYAIDPVAKTILLQRTLSPPIKNPLNCTNNARYVGVNSTPVIDLFHKTLFVMAYTGDKTGPIYRLHALDLTTLADKTAPVTVAATQTLSDGTTLAFDARYQRQRAALAEAGANVYAAFTSFCDFSANHARGWVMGWNAQTLKPAPAGDTDASLSVLTNHLATSPRNFFLSSIWMSGAGLAADADNNLYFATGNSDPKGQSYDGVNNVEESVIKYSPSLGRVVDLFTPSNWPTLDQRDMDFGSGGVMLLPPSVASLPPLAVAAGKFGQIYLMNRNALGGYTAGGPDNVLASQHIGGCWCAPSYFGGANPYVVSSGGRSIYLWQVMTSPISLKRAASSAALPTGQDSGFFTSVSSNGTADPIIWAVSRPQSEDDTTVRLFAFAGLPAPKSTTLTMLFSAPAGQWTSPDANANIVPVVANGRVYVASGGQLAIFGIGATTSPANVSRAAAAAADSEPHPFAHEVFGHVVRVSDATLVIRTRSGRIMALDISAALAAHGVVTLLEGEAVDAGSDQDAADGFHAIAVARAKPESIAWPPDY